MLMPLAFLMALAGSVHANSGKVHKIRTKMTGCLQAGPDSNSFVLNDISKGYTRRNQTGQDPFLLARTDNNTVLVPSEKAKLESKLKNNVGQRVKVSGYFVGQRSANVTAAPPDYSNSYTGGTAVVPEQTAEFKVTKIHKVSGSCP